jgi:acetyltransferase-like isoleucine patch superfamily enzyme
MFEFLALITNKQYWKFHSFLIKLILKFYIEGTPRLKIRGKGSNILIGDNVSIFGDIDLRNRENGKIIIENSVSFDTSVRLVSAREGTIKIDEGAVIGAYNIMNGGGNIFIGKKVLFAKGISINANEHKFEKKEYVVNQGYIYDDIIIEDDVWLGANVAVNKGVTIKKGAIVGTNAVVTKDIENYSINVGIPAKKISMRT